MSKRKHEHGAYITGESKSSKLLFNKTENLVKSLEQKADEEFNDIDLKPAWIDDDDSLFDGGTAENQKNVIKKPLFKEKLKQKYETLVGTPAWAKIKSYDEPNEILCTVGHLKSKKDKNVLRQEVLDLKRLSKINNVTHNEGSIINCIEFHPTASVALVAGTSGSVSLFSIGRETSKLHNFMITGWNHVTTASILPDGSQAYLSSSKYHQFCVYDLLKGEPKLVELPSRMTVPFDFKLSKDGQYIATCEGYDEVFILKTGSYELIRCLKHNNNVTSLAFSHNSKELYTFGSSGEVSVWDLSTYRTIKKFSDSGCVNASCIVNSDCGRLLATGSKEGIVNIYQTSELTSGNPAPFKTISNLRTAITHLKFNPTTEILSVASKLYPNALKMVHIPSYHVFKNVPEQNFSLNNVITVSFSPNGGFMGLGNDRGAAHLYRLKHYKNY